MASLLDMNFTGDPNAPQMPAPGVDLSAQTQAYQDQQAANKYLRDRLTQGADWSGAPFAVRAKVETASDPGSRLATLQTYAPDAQPLPGTSNFVFTDPKTGKRTIYDPGSWLDPSTWPGELTRLEQPAAGLVGGLVGGLLGGAAGGPAGAIPGVGVGGVAGQEVLQRAGVDLLGAKDVRTPGQIAAQDIPSAVLGSAFAAVPGLIGAGTVAPTMKAATTLDRTGVTTNLTDKLPLGVAANSPGLSIVENTLAQTPGGRGTIVGAYKDTNAEIGKGVGNVADVSSGNAPAGGTAAPNPADFATTVNGVAQKMGQQFVATRNTLDNAVKTAVGADAPTDISRLKVLRDNLQTQWTQGGTQTMESTYKPAIDELNKIISDAGTGNTVPFASLQRARSIINDYAYGQNVAMGQKLPESAAALKQAAGEISGTIQDQVNATGPAAQKAYADYNKFVRDYRSDPTGGNNDDLSVGATVENLQDPKLAADRLQRLASSSSVSDRQTFANFLNNANQAQRGEITGGMLNRIGLNKNGDFSPLTFMRNWGNMTDDAKNAMFTGPLAPLRTSLDNLATVSSGIRDSLETKAFSNTPASVGLMTAGGSAATALAAGKPGLAASIFGTTIGGPWITAKLMQSAPFVRWMAGASADQSPGAVSRALASLPAVAVADPAIADQVQQLRTRLGGGAQPQ